MSWNNGYERRKFEARQKNQAEIYRANGMTEEQIKEMYEFDLAQLNSDRSYYRHTQQLTTSDFNEGEDDDSESTLLNRFFDELTVSMEKSGDPSRYWWIEEINNSKLVKAIKRMTPVQIEMLTHVVVDGFGQAEIAEIMEVSQSAISQRFSTIKKILKTTL